jgi:hypothetical protein
MVSRPPSHLHLRHQRLLPQLQHSARPQLTCLAPRRHARRQQAPHGAVHHQQLGHWGAAVVQQRQARQAVQTGLPYVPEGHAGAVEAAKQLQRCVCGADGGGAEVEKLVVSGHAGDQLQQHAFDLRRRRQVRERERVSMAGVMQS